MEIKGFGSVVQLDKRKTRYKCRKWKLQVDTSEGRKQKRFNGSLSEAKAQLNNYIQQLEEDTVKLDKKFSEYSLYWLKIRKASNSFSPNTIATNERSIRLLNKLFKDEKMCEISPMEIKEKIYFLTNKNNEPVTNCHKVKVLDTLSLVFKMGVEDGIIKTNPCLKVKKPKIEKNTRRALSKEEFKNVIKCLSKEKTDGRQIAIYTILYLGLRRSEVCALKWKDYDKNNGTLKIQRAWKEGNASIGETKSNAGRRTLPVPQPLIDKLNKWHKICKPTAKEEDFICINSFGDMLRGVALYKYWKKFTDKHELPYVKIHELRHTNLTIVARYMSPFDLQHYAGWSDLGPAKIYIHKDQVSMKKAIDKIDFG